MSHLKEGKIMDIKQENVRISYALGMNLGHSLQQAPVEIDAEAAAKGLKDMLAGGEFLLSQEEYVKTLQDFQAKMQEMEKSAAKDIIEKNAAEEKAFLDKNKQADGVQSTASGLQYQVLAEGEGAKPGASDKVRVHYTGTLLDGTVFDSSVQRGQPAEFGVGQVIKGWTEALQLMNVGSKYKLFIPSALAYGERGAGQQITPGSMLVFEVELLDIL
jgi:FKBP-type peptidyl-prolyl cis-trans isomerase FklB